MSLRDEFEDIEGISMALEAQKQETARLLDELEANLDESIDSALNGPAPREYKYMMLAVTRFVTDTIKEHGEDIDSNFVERLEKCAKRIEERMSHIDISDMMSK